MVIIKNALLSDKKTDIFIKNGLISDAFIPDSKTRIIDAAGLIAAPGLVDMHVHLREPGYEYKEDISSGARAAAAGGVTSVACMPNTNPVADCAEIVSQIREKGKKSAVNVYPIGAVTIGQKGLELTDFAALKSAGAVALSDDGMPIIEASVMRRALYEAKKLDMLIISHCEDAGLTDGKALNEGRVSKLLGLEGRPASAEEMMVARDALLALETGARVHIAHVSTALSVDIIRKAKAAGAAITCETCPQYFILTEEAILEKGALSRVNPPLRTKTDVEGIIRGLQDKTIDAIATDHAPHSAEEKSRPLVDAPSGMIGLETSLALSLTYLCKPGHISQGELLRLMSEAPARILGLKKGLLEIGDDADLVLFDPNERWTVNPGKFLSKARNTPFGGYELTGRVKYSLVGGEIAYGL